MQLTTDDRLAIHELIALYGHLIDERQISRLDEIFTEDAVFDLRGFGGELHTGLAAISELMISSSEHPLAHHATNVVICDDADGVSVLSKGVGIGHGGRVGSVTYRDRLQATDRGWRICERLCELRRAESIPPVS